MDITVVVPLFNEEESLPELYAWIERVMKANNSYLKSYDLEDLDSVIKNT